MQSPLIYMYFFPGFSLFNFVQLCNCTILGISLCFKVLGEVEEFEKAVRLVIKDVSFDNDVVVSVFETNIRVLG